MQRLHTETSLSPETSIVRGLFIEMFLTALSIFTIFMLAAEKHRATFIAPIGIGLALFVAHLAGARFTGGSYSSSIPPQKVRKFGLHLLMRLFAQPA
jgi:aquaporin related protein